jgi:hypothetical protein
LGRRDFVFHPPALVFLDWKHGVPQLLLRINSGDDYAMVVRFPEIQKLKLPAVSGVDVVSRGGIHDAVSQVGEANLSIFHKIRDLSVIGYGLGNSEEIGAVSFGWKHPRFSAFGSQARL